MVARMDPVISPLRHSSVPHSFVNSSAKAASAKMLVTSWAVAVLDRSRNPLHCCSMSREPCNGMGTLT